ncbi:MAG: sugar phosphate nucleotidyltransferase [Terriglobia bacterium]
MKAMILAAGLGTRLHPLTLSRPKAMLEVQGVPLLALVLGRLVQQGFTEIIVNAHHFADQIISFLDEYRRHSTPPQITIQVSKEALLLDTGGGVQNAAWFFDDGKPFLVHNVDVLTDLNLVQLMNAHQSAEALVTLAVRERKTTRYFLFDRGNRLCGWQSTDPSETRLACPGVGPLLPLAFMGIQVVSPLIFEKLNLTAPFSLVEAYLQLASNGESLLAFRADDARWMDLGRKDHLERAPSVFGESFFRL